MTLYPNEESEFQGPVRVEGVLAPLQTTGRAFQAYSRSEYLTLRDSLRDLPYLWCDVCGRALEDGGSASCIECLVWAGNEMWSLVAWRECCRAVQEIEDFYSI